MISASCRKASGDIVPGFRVFTATSTLFCHVPFQTSPKFPAPSFLVSWICDLGISYWSLVAYSRALLLASLGAGLGQALEILDRQEPLIARYLLADTRADVMGARTLLRQRLERMV